MKLFDSIMLLNKLQQT